MIRNTIIVHGINHSNPAPTLTVFPESLNLSYTADSDTVEVAVAFTTQEWSYSVDLGHAPVWGYVSGASEIGNDITTIGVYENTTGSPRTGSVTFSSDYCDDVVVVVHQAANPV